MTESFDGDAVRYEGDRPVAVGDLRLAQPTRMATTSAGFWGLYEAGDEVLVVHPGGALRGPAGQVRARLAELAADEGAATPTGRQPARSCPSWAVTTRRGHRGAPLPGRGRAAAHLHPVRRAQRPSGARRLARIRRVDCSGPGSAAGGGGRSFSYEEPDGRPSPTPEALARIRGLGIPPAWKDVWICPIPTGHLQAVGTDAAGRRQYLYHEAWRTRREAAKFDHMLEFAHALPGLRERAAEHLTQPGLSP
jgi:hypothetical protein